MDSTTAAALISFLMSFLIVFVILAIVMYVFTALSLFTMAKNKGIDHAWLAWIPVAQYYLEGEILDGKVKLGATIPYAPIILLVAPILVSVCAQIDYLGTILSIVYAVYAYAAMFRLYKLYKPESAVVFLVLSIIIPILSPIFMFVVRNNTPVEYLEEV